MDRLNRLFLGVMLASTGWAFGCPIAGPSGMPCRVAKLLRAVDRGRREVVEELIGEIDFSQEYHFGWPLGFELLLRCARYQPFVAYDLLFEDYLYKTDRVSRYLNLCDMSGDPPLLLALKSNNPRAAFFFLALGNADPDLTDHMGRTALDIVLIKQGSRSVGNWSCLQYRKVHKLLTRCGAKTSAQLADQDACS